MKVGEKPEALKWAETLDALGQRYGVLPSVVAEADAGLLRMLDLLDPDCGKAKE